MRAVFLLAVAACRRDDDPVESDVFEPAPYVVPDDGADAPTFDRASVETGLQQAVDAIVAIEARPALDAYRVAMTWADDACPAWYTDQNGNTYWYAYCYASAGGTYSGYGYHYVYNDVVDANGTWDSEQLYLSATIDGPGGKRFAGTGGAAFTAGYNTELAYVTSSYLDGTFEWTDADAGSWLADGLSPQVSMYRYTYPGEVARYTYVDGAITGSASVAATVAFTETAIYQNVYWDAGCDLEPQGVISVRDDAGYWVDVYFDSVYDGTMDQALCDGCGAAWLRGEAVGEVCVDFSSWLGLPYVEGA